jgi:hypothetical protein
LILESKYVTSSLSATERAMMPVVRVNDAAFADLGVISKWLGTDTPALTIDAVIRRTMESLGLERDEEVPEAAGGRADDRMDFETAPGLAFTKINAATVGGVPLKNPNWASLLLATIEQVKGTGLTAEQLARELQIPAKASVYVDDGFRFHSNLGLSVQGQSAADAWKEVDRLATKWGVPVAVEFQWRQNEKAQHPGRVAVLRSGKV